MSHGHHHEDEIIHIHEPQPCDGEGHQHHHHADGTCCCEQHAKEFHGIDKPMLIRLVLSAALYLAAAKQNVEALAIFTVSNHLLTHESTPARDRERTFDDMARIALETIIQD